MSAKRTATAILPFSLFAVSLAVWLIFPFNRARVNRATFAEIEPGMMLSEAQAILGVPPGDYTGGRYGPVWRHKPVFSRVGSTTFTMVKWGEDQIFEWTTAEGHIALLCDKDGYVQRKFYDDVMLISASRSCQDWLQAFISGPPVTRSLRPTNKGLQPVLATARCAD